AAAIASADLRRGRLLFSWRAGPHPHALEISRNWEPTLDGVLKTSTLERATGQHDRSRLLLDITDFLGAEALEKTLRARVIELRVLRLDREEEPVLAGVLGETLDVEDRMVRQRQPVQREHARGPRPRA